MNLSALKPPAGQKHTRKRIGRGMGSGHGKTATRGSKGQHAGTGFSQKRGFEGGQMPLHRRLPKRGFTNIFKKQYAIVNLGRLEKLEGDSFTPDHLLERGVVRKLHEGLKVLGSGQLTRKIRVEAHLFSKSALEKIQAAGGEAVVIGGGPATGPDAPGTEPRAPRTKPLTEPRTEPRA
jgi:large subunit ribosomal protein L15